MIDDDEWMHTPKAWPLWLCALLVAGAVLAAWAVAMAVTWGIIMALK